MNRGEFSMALPSKIFNLSHSFTDLKWGLWPQKENCAALITIIGLCPIFNYVNEGKI
jgi:hypothetical protein